MTEALDVRARGLWHIEFAAEFPIADEDAVAGSPQAASPGDGNKDDDIPTDEELWAQWERLVQFEPKFQRLLNEIKYGAPLDLTALWLNFYVNKVAQLVGPTRRKNGDPLIQTLNAVEVALNILFRQAPKPDGNWHRGWVERT